MAPSPPRTDTVEEPTVALGTPAVLAPAAAPGGAAGPVFIDLETRSALDIEVGGRRYANDPSTEILTLAALWDDRAVVWAPPLERPLPADRLWPGGYEACGIPERPVASFAGPTFPAPLAAALAGGRALCAHNALGFDRYVWRARGLPEPAAWLDTLPEARAAGLPGELDEIGKRLVGVGKHAGKAVLRRLCRPDATGQFRPPTGADLAEVARYNLADVLLLARVHAVAAGSSEPEVVALDRAINDRGVAFDAGLARALIRLDEQAAAEAGAGVVRATGGAVRAEDLGRVSYLLDWLRGQGAALEDLQRPTVEAFLAGTGDQNPAVRAVLEARLTTAKISAGKLQRALVSLDADGRLREQFVYHGAHTGRWTGRGVQIQNLPRPDERLKGLPALREAAGDPDAFRGLLPPSVGAATAVSALVRPCLRAAPGKVLVIADFASIEARGVAWCAGEQGLLERFAAGQDVYCDLAGRLFGHAVSRAHERERKVGKIAILGCGYGMSARKFAEHARRNGVDLAAAGVTAEEVVEGYRDAYPAIAGRKADDGDRIWREGGLWRDVETLALAAIVLNESHQAGRCQFSHAGGTLLIRLPSGRPLRYRNARVEARIPAFHDRLGLPRKSRPTLVFDSPRQPGESTYGGKLVENIVQAISRDLLVEALLGCERAGLPVVLHVHDEIVAEVTAAEAEAALRRLAEIMSRPPAWAAGFPVEVEAFTADRYFKGSVAASLVARARDGQVHKLGVQA
jgi:DNA polymerase